MERAVYEERRGRLKKCREEIRVVSKKTGRVLKLEYKKNSQKFEASILKYNQIGGAETVESRNGLSDEEILGYLSHQEFEEELDVFFKDLEKQEREHEELRKSLLEQLEGRTDLSQEEKNKLRGLIVQMTQVHLYSPMENGVSVLETEHGKYRVSQLVRAGNEYDKSQPVALQVVNRLIPGYPAETYHRKIDFDEMVLLFRQRGILGKGQKARTDEQEDEVR